MRKHTKTFAFLCFLFFTLFIIAKTITLPFYVILSDNFLENHFYKIILNSDILSKCTENLSDIRLQDETDNYVPYVILNDIKPSYDIPQKSSSLKLLTFDEVGTEYFIIAELPESSELIRLFDFHTTSFDFDKIINVYESSDKKEWKFVFEGSIFDFSSKIKLRNTEIEIPSLNGKYVKFHIMDKKIKSHLKTEENTLNINYMGTNINLNQFTNKKLLINSIIPKMKTIDNKIENTYDEILINNFTQEKNNENETLISFECLYPATQIELDIKDVFSFRKVYVFSGETIKECKNKLKKNQYNILTEIKSSHGKTLKSTTHSININNIKNKFLIIVIKNDDNPSLKIKNIKLKWIRKNLLFMANKESNILKLYFGNNSDIKKPKYDFEMIINQNNWYKHQYKDVIPSYIMNNDLFKSKFFKMKKEKLKKTIISIITFTLIFILTAWFIKLMREN